jgi:hypothetical protein
MKLVVSSHETLCVAPAVNRYDLMPPQNTSGVAPAYPDQTKFVGGWCETSTGTIVAFRVSKYVFIYTGKAPVVACT